MSDKQVSISPRSVAVAVLITIGILLGLYILWYLRSVVVLIFISLILALALEPLVGKLMKYKFPRSVAVLTVVLLVIILIGGIGSAAVVPLTSEIQSLINNFPLYANYVSQFFGGQDAGQFFDNVLTQLSQTSGTILDATMNVFSSALNVVVTIVFTIYILIDFPNLRHRFVHLIPDGQRQDMRNLIVNVENKLGGWLRGQALLMLIIGLASYIGLLALGMPYALALALIAGLLEILPFIGPIIATIPAVIVGFSVDPLTGLGVLILYIIIQQLENHLIVPKVMQRAVGFNPLVTILALMVGSQFLGVLGAIIAVPVTIILYELYVFGMKVANYNSNNSESK